MNPWIYQLLNRSYRYYIKSFRHPSLFVLLLDEHSRLYCAEGIQIHCYFFACELLMSQAKYSGWSRLRLIHRKLQDCDK